MHKKFVLVLATLGASTIAFGQAQVNTGGSGFAFDAYQINYAANLNIGDSVVNITNTGVQGPFFGTAAGATSATAGNICVNTYVFDPQEE